MNRFQLALGLSLWSIGLHSTISGALNKLIVLQKIAPPGVNQGEVLLIVVGYSLMILGSALIAYAFPKKAT